MLLTALRNVIVPLVQTALPNQQGRLLVLHVYGESDALQ
jgi:hypothetical protein